MLSDIENLHDVWMLELGDCLGLEAEPCACHRPGVLRAKDHFHSQTQGSLLESREQLRAVVQTAADAIFTIDVHGIIDSVNPAASPQLPFGPVC
jgi:PAS domain-containing protein